MSLIRGLFALCIGLANTVTAAPATKYYSGDLYTYEWSERYESILGGAVTYLRAAGHDEFEPASDALLIEGILSQETLVHVQRLLPNTSGFTVFLDSPGGDLLAGLEVGRLFYKRESRAIVNRAAQCKSACALAFLAAGTRLVLGEPSALGFHRQYRLIDKKVSYGDINADRNLIDGYLRAIHFSGLSALEITSTTGDATFSESTLTERGLITATNNERKARLRNILAYSGVTPFEVASFLCAKYERGPLNPKLLSPEVIAILFLCGGRVPARREPLLVAAADLPATSTGDDLDTLDQEMVAKVLRSTDPAAVHSFNTAADGRTGNYARWLELRREVLERLNRPQGAE